MQLPNAGLCNKQVNKVHDDHHSCFMNPSYLHGQLLRDLIITHGEPASPTSESLAIIELSSQSSGEGKSDSGSQELEDDMDIRKGDSPEVGSGKSTDSSSMAVLTAKDTSVGRF